MPNSAPTSFLASLTNGFRSGLISPAPSTTPITPMTPLTTPRTPAQALIGRHPYSNRKDSNNGSTNNQRSRPSTPSQLPLLSDHDREQQLVALQLFANFLNAAENTIEDISERENDGKRVVGPGIMRLCNDLADGIEQVAEELDREHQHIEKVMSDHDLRLIEEGSKEGDSNSVEAIVVATATDDTIVVLPSSHEELLTTISAAHSVLLDMAAALRGITQEEAQELGEVALEVANMFVWSLRMVYSNMMQMIYNENDKSDDLSQKAAGTKAGQVSRCSRHRWRQGCTAWTAHQHQRLQAPPSKQVGFSWWIQGRQKAEARQGEFVSAPSTNRRPTPTNPPPRASRHRPSLGMDHTAERIAQAAHIIRRIPSQQ